jgi:predicted nucleic acid-binding protein
MKLLDSNIVIYSYQPAFSFLKSLVIDPDNAVSAISRLETLGFHGLQPGEQTYCEYAFRILQQLPVDDTVLEEAIRLRKTYRMKLADSIVAATALLNNAELNTRNLSDFKNIPGLMLVNPIP